MNRRADTGRDVTTGFTWERVRGQRRPALRAAAFLAAGIFAARYLPLSPLAWGVLAWAALVGLLAGRRNGAALFLMTVALWFGLGAFCYSVETQVLPPNHVSRFLNSPEDVEMFGRVVDLPDRRETATNLTVDLRSLNAGSVVTLVSGRILVRSYDTARQYSYGDYLRFTGRLVEPQIARNPGGFNYRRHLLDRGIHAVVSVARNHRIRVYPDPGGATFINRLIIPLREYILGLFRTYVPGQGGALLAGYLLGETREMPPELYDAYRRSGVLHLLAVSGSNVWLVLGLFWFAFRLLHFPRPLQTTLLLAILVVFCFAARNEPSVVRAGLMAALVLLAGLFRRRIDLLNIAGVSAVVILLVSPRHVFLPGFQLSFAAVFGILVLVPRFLRAFPLRRWGRIGRWVVTLVGSSVAAIAATAPVTAVHFGTIPTIAVAANLVMVPLAGLLTNSAVILAIVGGLWAAAARLVGEIIGLLAGWSIAIVHMLETIPVGQVRWPYPSVLGIVNFVLILCAVAAWPSRFRWAKAAVFYALLVAATTMTALVFSSPRPLGEVMFLDAGREPLVGMTPARGQGRLIGSPGAFSPSNQQWVIEPYAIDRRSDARDFTRDTLPPQYSRPRPGPVNISAWQPRALSAIGEPGLQHLRLTDGASSSRPIADYLGGLGFQLLIVYQDDPELVSSLLRRLPNRDLDVLALARSMPSPQIAEDLQNLKVHHLILFGIPPWMPPEAVHAAWMRQLPAHRVWSTSRHGGLRVVLSSPVNVVPTIP